MIKITLALAMVTLIHHALIDNSKIRKIEESLNKPLLMIYLIIGIGYIIFIVYSVIGAVLFIEDIYRYDTYEILYDSIFTFILFMLCATILLKIDLF